MGRHPVRKQASPLLSSGHRVRWPELLGPLRIWYKQKFSQIESFGEVDERNVVLRPPSQRLYDGRQRSSIFWYIFHMVCAHKVPTATMFYEHAGCELVRFTCHVFQIWRIMFWCPGLSHANEYHHHQWWGVMPTSSTVIMVALQSEKVPRNTLLTL